MLATAASNLMCDDDIMFLYIGPGSVCYFLFYICLLVIAGLFLGPSMSELSEFRGLRIPQSRWDQYPQYRLQVSSMLQH